MQKLFFLTILTVVFVMFAASAWLTETPVETYLFWVVMLLFHIWATIIHKKNE